jgi:O-antigen biosynthesis protein WbqP
MYLQIGKRAADILCVILALSFLWPLLLFTAILIKIYDPGPIIFKQFRIGRGGKKFLFYKFRSMPVNTGDVSSDKVGQIKLTWIGRLTRRTNIDELPQLFNILLGDMSVVGPRPPLPAQEDLINLRSDNGALLCRPGLTGLAQIKSYDGMTVSEKAGYDGIYSQKITLCRDIQIILKTFLYLLSPPPTY